MQNFTNIRVSDLRARTGQILDDVTESEEVFLVQRKGRPLACLGPVKHYLPEIPMRQIVAEFDALHDADEEPRATVGEDKTLIFWFPQEIADGKTVTITVELPHGYPENQLKVRLVGIDPPSPHEASDGSIPLFGSAATWTPDRPGVVRALSDARTYLQEYVKWVETGSWVNDNE